MRLSGVGNYAGEHMEMTRDFGTWHVGCGNGEGSVFADGEGRMRMGQNGTTLTAICTVHDFDGERDAHARLIAAAPELLAALHSFLRAPSIGSNGPGSATIVVQEYNIRAAERAISKATGETT